MGYSFVSDWRWLTSTLFTFTPEFILLSPQLRVFYRAWNNKLVLSPVYNAASVSVCPTLFHYTFLSNFVIIIHLPLPSFPFSLCTTFYFLLSLSFSLCFSPFVDLVTLSRQIPFSVFAAWRPDRLAVLPGIQDECS